MSNRRVVFLLSTSSRILEIIFSHGDKILIKFFLFFFHILRSLWGCTYSSEFEIWCLFIMHYKNFYAFLRYICIESAVMLYPFPTLKFEFLTLHCYKEIYIGKEPDHMDRIFKVSSLYLMLFENIQQSVGIINTILDLPYRGVYR